MFQSQEISYGDVGYQAWGSTGRFLVDMSIVISQIGKKFNSLPEGNIYFFKCYIHIHYLHIHTFYINTVKSIKYNLKHDIPIIIYYIKCRYI